MSEQIPSRGGVQYPIARSGLAKPRPIRLRSLQAGSGTSVLSGSGGELASVEKEIRPSETPGRRGSRIALSHCPAQLSETVLGLRGAFAARVKVVDAAIAIDGLERAGLQVR